MFYLFDTNILIALIRDRALGRYVEATYPIVPGQHMLSLVSVGEIRSLAIQFGWSPSKLQRMETLIRSMTLFDLSETGVVEAYVEVDLACRANPGGARVLSKNDLWIAATARATGAALLTTDQDFDVLHPALIHRVYVDPSSTLPPPTP